MAYQSRGSRKSVRASRKGFPGGSCGSAVNDAVRQRFAVVLALVGVALHVTALAANPSQGFVTEGFAVLLLALAVGGAPVARDLLAADVAPAESPDADEQR
jgi:hypothetical protein